MKKTNQDPFSNGEEFRWWFARNCERCIKSPKELGVIARCAIYRDIEKRFWSDEPIAQRTIDITRKSDCPYKREHYPKRKRKSKTANLTTLLKEK